jgi:hypothetical protein
MDCQFKVSASYLPYHFGSRGCRLLLLLPAGVMMFASGCAGVDKALEANAQLASAELASVDVQECAAWFTKLDEITDRAGVRDAEARQIPGFPYVRVNRFLASFREQAQKDQTVFAAWQKRLRELDARARSYELKNLPPSLLATLPASSRSAAAARTDQCAFALAKHDAASAARRDMLAALAQVPDDYADWQRSIGLYSVAKVPFFEFAKGWQKEATAMFERAAAGASDQQNIVRYQPPGNAAPAQRIVSILATARTDALGIPQFGDREVEILFATFAPVFEIETSGDYDRIGPLRWAGGGAPEVDVSRPTIYRRIAFTRYGAHTLPQLVYMIWFPERPQSNALDPLSGKLDGIVFRVTLDRTGRPLVYDSIHLCGCYHMFFPTPRVKPIPAPDPDVEWAFIPRSLPAIDPPQRLVLRVTSRSHYLTDIRLDTGSRGTTYAMADDGELRTLPYGGGTRSVFGPNGIVTGTDRGERMVTWSLGIEDAGAMREWGRHATALIGRRQFDDADLIERRFQVVPAVETMPKVSARSS